MDIRVIEVNREVDARIKHRFHNFTGTWAIHLAADACTRAGILLLYPRMKRFHLLPKRFRIVTGSLAEDVVFALLSMSVLALLSRHLLALSA